MAQNFPKDLATFLNTEITSLTLGTNLFYNTKLLDNEAFPDSIVCIYSYKPKKAERCFGNVTEVVYKRAIILVRGANCSENSSANEEAEDLCIQIYEKLQTCNITPYQDIKFNSGFEEGNKDEQNRYVWSADIESWYNRIVKQSLTFEQAKNLTFQQLLDQEITYNDLI